MSKLYFNEDVDQAIILFQLEIDLDKKNEIFERDIKPAFDKLINYYYYKYPVARNPEILYDCLSDLYEKIDKFNPEKYKRGFPYFNVIVRNFFIQKLKSEKKESKNSQYVQSISSIQGKSDTEYSMDIEETFEKVEFNKLLIEFLPKWRDQFKKEQEKKIVDGLILLFENVDNLGSYNKKAIFFYLKEITGLNPKQVATNLNKVKKKFLSLKKKYEKGEI